MTTKTKTELAAVAAWAVVGLFLITGVQQILGNAVAGLAAFAYAFALPWFMEKFR